MEREFTKAREVEARSVDFYETSGRIRAAKRELAITGKKVVKGKEQPWQMARQGRLKFLVHESLTTDVCVLDWNLFLHDIRNHSGRHRHQGGLALYVLEGKGWTVVDGVRYDWEEGDLILLPVKPRGCEHQHFNAEPGKPCVWLAFIYEPFDNALGNELEQKEESPDWANRA